MRADRRRAIRFEFVGEQWGSLHALEPLRLHNFGREGVLIESANPLTVGSTHVIRLVHQTGTADCRVVVRHLSPVSQAGNGHRHLIGLQFVNLDDQATALIAHVLAEPANPLRPNEA
jgi:PilZ domain